MDPVLAALPAVLFAALFLAAAAHKIADRRRFRRVLEEWRVLPPALAPAAARAVPLLELALGLGWAFGLARAPVAVASALLLAAYGALMALNLARGRARIDCGCGLRGGRPLSYGLVARNLALAVCALLPLAGAAGRAPVALDHFTVAACALALAALYGAAGQLLANRAALRAARGARP